MPEKKKKKPAQPQMVKHKIELVVVGLKYRVTTSTRRYLAKTVMDKPIFCSMVREPENTHDENAIKVVVKEGTYKGMHIGYIQRGVAVVLAVLLDEGGIQDELLAITSMDVDTGEADAELHFMAPKSVQGHLKT